MSFIDPFGLVDWEGKFFSLVGGLRGGAAGFYIFNLTSECIDGKQVRVRVYADGVGVGLSVFPISETGGKIEFEDDRSIPDGSVFNGEFLSLSASVAWGLGGSVSKVRLGYARSKGWGGLIGGIDSGSLIEISGTAVVTNETPISCGCSE